MSHPTHRGPFKVAVVAGGRELGSGTFDTKFEGHTPRDHGAWRAFQAVLPDGEVTLQISKVHEGASGHARLVDCVLLTMESRAIQDRSGNRRGRGQAR